MEKLLILFLQLYSTFYTINHLFNVYDMGERILNFKNPETAKNAFLSALFFTGIYLWFFKP